MCLNTIIRTISPTTTKEYPAYKVVMWQREYADGGTQGHFYGNPYHRFPRLMPDTWISREASTEGDLLDAADGTYQPGFHVLTTRRAASRFLRGHFDRPGEVHDTDLPYYKVIKVKVRHVHTIGTQASMRCLVANEIFVSSEAMHGPSLYQER